jgi:hypothetical protein
MHRIGWRAALVAALTISGWPTPPEYRTDAELFDPETGCWVNAGTFSGTGIPIGGAALPDGRALVQGWCGDRATVIYTPEPR